MKIYLVQPTLFRTGHEIFQERDSIRASLKLRYGSDVVFLNTVVTDKCPMSVNVPAVWSLGKSLEMMSQADLVYFTARYQESPLCLLEYTVAKTYGMALEVAEKHYIGF